MPELPDITIYVEALQERIMGEVIQSAQIGNPFLLRTVEPPFDVVEGRAVIALRRMGKRVVWQLQGDLFLVFHLMIAGRFRWSDNINAKPAGKIRLASFRFSCGSLTVTEAAARKRASLHLVNGVHALSQFDSGGLEVLDASFEDFREALLRERHTVKRALSDPRLFSGIGNAYSDEILHAARLSPFKLTTTLGPEEIKCLQQAAVGTLGDWLQKLRDQFGGRFPGPGQIAAFRPGFAVHGRFGDPCPACRTKVQRIRYAENETNYCPRCQTGGKVLADRSLSRLLKDDWPKSL